MLAGFWHRVPTTRALWAVHHLLCGALILQLAIVIRTGELPELATAVLMMQGTPVVCVCIFSFLIGLNQGSWCYALIDNLPGIIEMSVLAVPLTVIVIFSVSRLEAIPRAVPAIARERLILLMGALRLSYRALKERNCHRLLRAHDRGGRVPVIGFSEMVMISTDKVVNLTNMMDATRRFAEAYCKLPDRRPDHSTRFMTVRFGNALDSSGSAMPLFSRQIEADGPVTSTHPGMKRYFMSMKEVVRRVLATCAKGVANPTERGRIMVPHICTQARVVDIATRIIRLAGLRPEVVIPIRYIGLGPDEKLNVERPAASDLAQATADNCLQIATPRDMNGRNKALVIDAGITACR